MHDRRRMRVHTGYETGSHYDDVRNNRHNVLRNNLRNNRHNILRNSRNRDPIPRMDPNTSHNTMESTIHRKIRPSPNGTDDANKNCTMDNTRNCNTTGHIPSHSCSRY